MAVSALILACATVAVLLRGGDTNGNSVRLECVDPLVCGGLALGPIAQWTPTATATAELSRDASPQAENSESPGARKLDAGPARSPGDPGASADVQSGAAPGRDGEGTALGAMQYPCWPTYLWPAVAAVEQCESHSGADPLTWDVTAANGGPLQIAHDPWAAFFWETEGWSWEEIVRVPDIHYCAAWIIFERAGYTWVPWSCSYVVQ